MGGFFGAVCNRDVVLDVFFGTDYHSHLGTRNAGLVYWDPVGGFQRQIHSIANSPFRTKFEDDLANFGGCCGAGCICLCNAQIIEPIRKCLFKDRGLGSSCKVRVKNYDLIICLCKLC